MTDYVFMLNSLDDIVKDFGYGPELTDDFAGRLNRVKEGNHYGEDEARLVLLNVAKELRELAAKIEALANHFD